MSAGPTPSLFLDFYREDAIADQDTATTVGIAAHEMLHPPVPMDGPAASAALAVFERPSLANRLYGGRYRPSTPVHH